MGYKISDITLENFNRAIRGYFVTLIDMIKKYDKDENYAIDFFFEEIEERAKWIEKLYNVCKIDPMAIINGISDCRNKIKKEKNKFILDEKGYNIITFENNEAIVKAKTFACLPADIFNGIDEVIVYCTSPETGEIKIIYKDIEYVSKAKEAIMKVYGEFNKWRESK